MSIGASTRWVLAPPTVGHCCLAAGGRGRPGREREEDQRAVPGVSVVSAPRSLHYRQASTARHCVFFAYLTGSYASSAIDKKETIRGPMSKSIQGGVSTQTKKG
jgi:hypothetical protein